MPLATYAEFGVQDVALYEIYLRANIRYAECAQGEGSDEWRDVLLRDSRVRGYLSHGVGHVDGGGCAEDVGRSREGESDSRGSGSGVSKCRVRDFFDKLDKKEDDFAFRVVPDAAGRSGVSGFCTGFVDGVSEVGFGEKEVKSVDEKTRGKNWKKNQRRSASRKDKAKVLSCDEEIKGKPKDALRLSLEKKWALENELKAAKAARELELLKAEDLSAVKKLRERKVQGATERTMVQIEKAHASLVRSGDVPGARPGFCQTVVDGEIVESVPGLSGGSGECSISPSSSISEREVREMKKELEDVKAENEKLKKRNYRISEALKVKGGDDIAVSVRYGDVAESAKEAFDDVCGVGSWEATGDLDLDPDTLYVGLKNEVYCGGYDYSY